MTEGERSDGRERLLSMLKKPQRRIMRVEYWFCGDESHHHRSPEVAQRCIDRRVEIGAAAQVSPDDVMRLRREGKRFVEICELMKISRTRAYRLHDIAERAERRKHAGSDRGDRFAETLVEYARSIADSPPITVAAE
jgi:hypothetical protein